MFRIDLKPEAIRRLRAMKPFLATQIVDAIETHLRDEPERPSKSRIKRLRGQQKTTFRLRVGDYRVFYDVHDDMVTVTVILHKSETVSFYNRSER